MTEHIKEIDAFDRAYCERVREALWKAVVDVSRDPATGVAVLRNYEVYDALLQLQAMILASSKEAQSPRRARETSEEFAKRLRQLVARYRRKYEAVGLPFEVVHTDELQ